MKNIAIIPARSGSKGLKDKNIIDLCGKPLMWYTIQAAVQSRLFDTIMVSTDSKLYAEIAQMCGAEVPFLRSHTLSKDSSNSWDVVREVLNEYKGGGEVFDYIALLQPTSPLRTAVDIQNAYKYLEEKKANSVVSIAEVDHPVQWCFRIHKDGYINDLAYSSYKSCRRQDLEKYYRENGAIYIVEATKIMDINYDLYADRCYGYCMGKEQSIDIDTSFDLEFAEYIMKRSGGEKQ